MKKLIAIVIGVAVLGFILYSEAGSKNSREWDVALIKGNEAIENLDLPLARKYYQESLEAAKKIWGPESHQAGTSYNKLGQVFYKENDLNAAEKNIGQAWRIADTEYKDSDKRKGYILGDYADVLARLYRFGESIQYYEKALKLIELVNPPIWRDIARLKLGYAEVLYQLDNSGKAKELIIQSANDYEKELKKEYKGKFERELRAEYTTAFCNELINIGSPEIAAVFTQRASELALQEFGEKSAKYSKALKSQALSYLHTGKVLEAEQLFKKAVNNLNPESGNSLNRAKLFSNLAWLEYNRFNLQQALKYNGLAIDEAERVLGVESEFLYGMFKDRIIFFLNSGDLANAAAAADKALALALGAQKNIEPDIKGAVKMFVLTRPAGTSSARINELLKQISVKYFTGAGDRDLYSRVDMLLAFSDILINLKAFEDANKFIEEAVQITPTDLYWSGDVHLILARNLRELGKIDKAIKSAKEGLSKSETLAKGTWRHLWALRVLANTYRIGKNYEESKSTYNKAMQLIGTSSELAKNPEEKLKLYKEMSDLFAESGQDADALYMTLKIYRNQFLKHPVISLSEYLPRLSMLAKLAEQNADNKLKQEVVLEMANYKTFIEKVQQFQDKVVAEIQEEINRQQQKSMKAETEMKLFSS